MKLQEFVTVTTITITRSRYTALILKATDHQRAGTKVTEDLHSRKTPKLSTKDLPKVISEAELQAEATGGVEAYTHQDPYTACTMATKSITAPRTASSTWTPNAK
jgi:hypothetical protein